MPSLSLPGLFFGHLPSRSISVRNIVAHRSRLYKLNCRNEEDTTALFVFWMITLQSVFERGWVGAATTQKGQRRQDEKLTNSCLEPKDLALKKPESLTVLHHVFVQEVQ